MVSCLLSNFVHFQYCITHIEQIAKARLMELKIFVIIFISYHIIFKAEENSSRLKGHNQARNGKSCCNTATIKSTQTARQKNNDKTTRLLSVILSLFLLAEFPQGILGMMSAILGQKFFLECYNPVGEMMDIVALTNSAINFILYCIMSSQFRQTMKKLYNSQKKSAANGHYRENRVRFFEV